MAEVVAKKRGAPLKFKAKQVKHILSVIRKSGLVKGRAILLAEGLSISLPTMGKLAKADGTIKLQRGRPKLKKGEKKADKAEEKKVESVAEKPKKKRAKKVKPAESIVEAPVETPEVELEDVPAVPVMAEDDSDEGSVAA